VNTSCGAANHGGSRPFKAALLLLIPIAHAADVNYIIIDIPTRQIIKQDWPDADRPIPVGSLVKPFTALASSGPFPELVCNGTVDRCWLAKGHGRIAFRDALANSCNAYFLQLAQNVDAHSLAVVAAKFGIPPPVLETPEARIGLGQDWQISPLALTRAYCELTSRAAEPRVAEILAGMKLAAESGTASAIGHGALAKTGTAPCIAKRKHQGDGFTIVLAPADSPRIALLVRVHGVPGAEAAKSAALLLRQEGRQ
jgi:cell division protein FtsI/penicillin-binding protein 2